MSGIDRRRFLQGAVAAAGGVTVGALAESGLSPADADGAVAAGAAAAVAFHGPHQPGVLQVPQRSACFAAFDITARSNAELTALMKILTARIRDLMRGGPARDVGISAPALDSGILGPDAPADGLTVLVGLGASVFDHRFGLSGRKPQRLRRMDTFSNDNLDRARCDGDLVLQIAAESPDAVLHACVT